MLTRRGFAGAACAICGITEFIATEALAQGAPPATTPGVTRKILSQQDGPMPGYVTVLVDATIDAGTPVARHTNPGIEWHYILQWGFIAHAVRPADPYDRGGRWLLNTTGNASCGRCLATPRPECSSPML
jgi:hypothetical protein